MNKKNMLVSLSACVLAVAVLSACGAKAQGAAPQTVGTGAAPAAASVSQPAPQPTAAAASITEAQAKETARKNAGFEENEVQFVHVGLVQNADVLEYKIEFLAANGTKEYDYHINAATGEIISMDRVAENYRANGAQQPQSSAAQSVPAQTQAPTAQQPVQTPAAPQTGAAAQSQYIGEASAKQIALSHAGIAETDANFVRCFLDFDDGRWEYEVEFYSGATEYDYDIDAVTGDILAFDYDAEYYAPGTSGQIAGGTAPVNGTSLTAEQARQIALQHVGMSEQDIRYMDVDFDYEWGRAVYEFEWKSGWTEYSVTVDANTGEIVGYEQDWD